MCFQDPSIPTFKQVQSTFRGSFATLDTMDATSSFLRFWSNDLTRDTFLSFTSKQDLSSLRLACQDFGAQAAPHLFREVGVTFRPSLFTKPARMAALERIGHHIRTFTFTMPHSPDTFLPPLVDIMTGEEIEFIYTPSYETVRNPADRHSVPKYGSWEMMDLLVKQYPPLFHAATDVPSFVRVLNAQPNLRHLKVSCPGQEPSYRYRRNDCTPDMTSGQLPLFGLI